MKKKPVKKVIKFILDNKCCFKRKNIYENDFKFDYLKSSQKEKINFKETEIDLGKLSKSTTYSNTRIDSSLNFSFSNGNSFENTENEKNEDNSSNLNNNDNFELSSKTKELFFNIYNKKEKFLCNDSKKHLNYSIIDDNGKIAHKKEEIENKNFLILKDFDERPFISANTIKLINKIKKERNKKIHNTEDKKDISFTYISSLSYKYEDLIKKHRELRLPIKYKNLYNYFLSLEQVISLNKVKNDYNLNNFENIKKNIKSITNCTFTLDIFEQILYVAPFFYILKYVEKIDKSNKDNEFEFLNSYDLFIDIPLNFHELLNTEYPKDFNFLKIIFYDKNNIDKFIPLDKPLSIEDTKYRNNIFKNLLNNIVNDYHSKFLIDNEIEINFDPLIQNTWHHLFDPDKICEDIPKFVLPFPEKENLLYENEIKKNVINNQIVNNDLNLTDSNNTNTPNDTIEDNNITETTKKNINNKFVNQKQDDINNNIKEIKNYYNTKKDISDFYAEVLLQIKTILLDNYKSMKLNKFIELILNSSIIIKETIKNNKKMELILIELSKIFKDLFCIEYSQNYDEKIIVLNNKNYIIPSEKEIEKLLFIKKNS